jgi:hypothetical protein
MLGSLRAFLQSFNAPSFFFFLFFFFFFYGEGKLLFIEDWGTNFEILTQETQRLSNFRKIFFKLYFLYF